MIRIFCLILLASFTLSLMAQDSPLPYAQIPDYPDSYSSGNVLSRMVDGLGFRYYWATEGLTQQDLDFKPSDEARTTLQTLQHIYGLSETIKNAPTSTPNTRSFDWSKLTYQDLRSGTLMNLKKASELYASLSEEDLSTAKVIFRSGEFPMWNMINGPISDALWHTGQVVSFRRSSGNPFNSKVSVLRGRLGN